jgi:hypothetical protein
MNDPIIKKILDFENYLTMVQVACDWYGKWSEVKGGTTSIHQKEENVGLSSLLPPFALFPCDKKAGGLVPDKQTNKQTNKRLYIYIYNFWRAKFNSEMPAHLWGQKEGASDLTYE